MKACQYLTIWSIYTQGLLYFLDKLLQHKVNMHVGFVLMILYAFISLWSEQNDAKSKIELCGRSTAAQTKYGFWNEIYLKKLAI